MKATMIPNRILVPLAYLAAFQCTVLFFAFRAFVPQQGWWLPAAGLAGIVSGLVMSQIELLVIDVVQRRRRKPP